MKSSNAKLSMKLIDTAISALENAANDLKNDSEIRRRCITERLFVLIKLLKQTQTRLKRIGY